MQSEFDDYVIASLFNKNPKKGWRIKVDDEYITTLSGRTLWDSKTEAIWSFRNHFEHFLTELYVARGEEDFFELRKEFNDIYEKFVCDRVKYVEFM